MEEVTAHLDIIRGVGQVRSQSTLCSTRVTGNGPAVLPDGARRFTESCGASVKDSFRNLRRVHECQPTEPNPESNGNDDKERSARSEGLELPYSNRSRYAAS